MTRPIQKKATQGVLLRERKRHTDRLKESGGYPHPVMTGEGTPIQSQWGRGYHIQSQFGGVPHPDLEPDLDRGYPRVPLCPDLGSDLDGGGDTPTKTDWMGVPSRKGPGTSGRIMGWRWCTPGKGHGVPPRVWTDRRASTTYARQPMEKKAK